jgi:hypothetical protein
MPFMLLYLDLRERKKFDAKVLARSFVAAGANPCDPMGANCAAEFDYELDGDITTIRVRPDLETINLDGTGLASFDFAWRLQQNCSEPIHIVDEQYNFDFVISEFDSLESLMRAANKAMNE